MHVFVCRENICQVQRQSTHKIISPCGVLHRSLKPAGAMNASLEEEVGQHTVDRKVPAQL